MEVLLKLTDPRPRFPALVLIIIAPFTPSEPYKAAAFAPFNTVMLSISLGFKRPISGIGTPSTTYNGAFGFLPSIPAVRCKERVPRKVICAAGSTLLSYILILNPATLLDKPNIGFTVFPPFNTSLLTYCADAPISLDERLIPRAPVITTSVSWRLSLYNSTSMLALFTVTVIALLTKPT